MTRYIQNVFFAIFLVFDFSATASVIEVCSLCKVNSITAAIDKAKDSDTIIVNGGTYSEGVISIKKSISLIGINKPVVDGMLGEHVFFINADDVLVRGFCVKNSGVSCVAELAGIFVNKSKRCIIKDNLFINNAYSIYLCGSDFCLIDRNIMIGNAKDQVSGGNGIHAWYSSSITASNNMITRHRDGIYLEFASNSNVENNFVAQNIRYGLHFMFSNGNEFRKNKFIENQTGVAVMYSKKIKMLNNIFSKSWGRASYGILLKEISDSVINENVFSSNTVAIFSDGSNRNKFTNNIFKLNGWAADIWGSSDNNVFKSNSFLGNYFDIKTNSKNFRNIFTMNFWSKYKGYDLNLDGIGDIPHRPMSIFSLWVSRFSELLIMLNSPVIEFLEIAENIFPILTPAELVDISPLMMDCN